MVRDIANRYEIDVKIVARFWPKVDIRSESECWNWIANKDKYGYGMFKGRVNGERRNVSAHRLAYHLTFGLIPDGLTIDHLCKNKSCVNPYHMEAVTSQENTLRADGPAANNARRDLCKNGHPLIPNPWKTHMKRVCLVCKREYERKRWNEKHNKKKVAHELTHLTTMKGHTSTSTIDDPTQWVPYKA